MQQKQSKEKIFEILFRHYYAAMYRLAFTFLQDKEESKDIVSEVFARLWNSKPAMKAGSEKAFLLTCIRNECINTIARKNRDDKLRRLYSQESTHIMPADSDEEHRLKQLLHAINKHLTPQAAHILHLRYGEGKSYRETAKELGVSVSTINKHIVKALRTLRSNISRK